METVSVAVNRNKKASSEAFFLLCRTVPFLLTYVYKRWYTFKWELFPFFLFFTFQGSIIMKEKRKVVIGGVDYSIVGNKTPDGFTIVKPKMVWVNIRSLFDLLAEKQAMMRRQFVDPNHRELRNLCDECLKIGDKVSAKIVACKETTTNGFSYKIVCSCGDVEKLYTIADDFVEQFKSQSVVGKNASFAKAPTMRTQAFASPAT